MNAQLTPKSLRYRLRHKMTPEKNKAIVDIRVRRWFFFSSIYFLNLSPINVKLTSFFTSMRQSQWCICFTANILADRQTGTQADTQTYSLQYFATSPAGEVINEKNMNTIELTNNIYGPSLIIITGAYLSCYTSFHACIVVWNKAVVDSRLSLAGSVKWHALLYASLT